MIKARRELDAALLALRTRAPSEAVFRRAQVAMRQIEDVLARYHHAPNLRSPDARPHALALRPLVQGLLYDADAVLVLHGDIFYFRPEIYEALARAAERLGRRDAAGFRARAEWLTRALIQAASPDVGALTGPITPSVAPSPTPAAGSGTAR